MTGSGRSARKTGRRAPSERSGCRLSDCFLETHTYIYRHRKGKRKKSGQAGFSYPPAPIQKRKRKEKLARIRRPPAEIEKGRLSCTQAGVLVSQIFQAPFLLCKLIQVKILQKTDTRISSDFFQGDI